MAQYLPCAESISHDSLLFLDEIQAVPEAIPALRYFFEDMPELAVVCAGSLLEYALRDHHFSMPVGRVEYLHMGPMTFTEFLDALDEPRLASTIREFVPGKAINPVIHDRLLDLLRHYYFVGGMPEAVRVFAETRSLQPCSSMAELRYRATAIRQRTVSEPAFESVARVSGNAQAAYAEEVGEGFGLTRALGCR